MLTQSAKGVLASREFPRHLVIRTGLAAAGAKILMSGFEKGMAAAFCYGPGKRSWAVIAGTKQELDRAEHLYIDIMEGIQ